jgi:uncharacterized membrane protein YoaK (UPF0700 family)
MRNFLVLVLAVVGASVDALSYLGLGRVFTANMTGNMVLLGLAAAELDLGAAVRAGGALAAFALGVGAVTQLERRIGTGGRPWPRATTTVILAELVLLGVTAAVWVRAGEDLGDVTRQILIALLSVAMGMQSAAVTWLGLRGVVTTYVTGTITSVIGDLVLRRQGSGRGFRLLMLALYVLGALIGGLLYLAWGKWAALLPAVAVAIVVAAAALLPWPAEQDPAT